ncbi:hypothetical protein HanPI659440_Chr07g0264811 [Helianthus annuus]|nr:hypothetical protein HanPI659440_Chr07g0264811 [Helianthus annuus]
MPSVRVRAVKPTFHFFWSGESVGEYEERKGGKERAQVSLLFTWANRWNVTLFRNAFGK